MLLAVAGGLTNAEIANRLHIGLSTVKTHLASLMTKLAARNRVEIAMWAYETGRIPHCHHPTHCRATKPVARPGFHRPLINRERRPNPRPRCHRWCVASMHALR